MKTLDDIWAYSSQLNENYTVEEHDEDITIVRNIFKYPDLVLDFQKLLSVWESTGSGKPGLMSLKMPWWTPVHIAEEIFDWGYDDERSESEYIYFYTGNVVKYNKDPNSIVSNQCLLPHNDAEDNVNPVILGVVNLNQRNVRTGFWSFKGEVFLDEELTKEYYDYSSDITKETFNSRINDGTIDHLFDHEYGFNDAIFYDSRILHQPHIDDFYTRENPRIMYRVSFTLEPEDELDEDDD